MKNENFEITKSTGEKVKFSLDKLRSSLKRTGADDILVKQIKVSHEKVYHEIICNYLIRNEFRCSAGSFCRN